MDLQGILGRMEQEGSLCSKGVLGPRTKGLSMLKQDIGGWEDTG